MSLTEVSCNPEGEVEPFLVRREFTRQKSEGSVQVGFIKGIPMRQISSELIYDLTGEIQKPMFAVFVCPSPFLRKPNGVNPMVKYHHDRHAVPS